MLPAEQTLDLQILLDTAPLRLLSLQHTGFSNVDLIVLCTLLTANPADSGTQASLTVLKLGPPVHWRTDSTGQQLSEATTFASDAMQQLMALPGSLPELQVLQVWGLDEEQQLTLREAWTAIKGAPVVKIVAGSARFSTSRQASVAVFYFVTQQAHFLGLPSLWSECIALQGSCRSCYCCMGNSPRRPNLPANRPVHDPMTYCRSILKLWPCKSAQLRFAQQASPDAWLITTSPTSQYLSGYTSEQASSKSVKILYLLFGFVCCGA